MSNPRVVALPNFSQPFTLEVDTSGRGIGSVLMLGPKARVASTYEKEAMAILEALKKWKHYFASTTVIIETGQ
jgi:hypothetical protein